MIWGKIYRLLREAFKEWGLDHAAMLGAALAYYAIFAIGPLVVMITGIVEPSSFSRRWRSSPDIPPRCTSSSKPIGEVCGGDARYSSADAYVAARYPPTRSTRASAF